MTLICFASQKGSPGATATSLAVAASFKVAKGRRKLLLEADSTGGTLAIRYRMAPEPGLLTLAAAVRGGLDSSDDLWRHVQELPGGMPVIVCPDGPEQVNAAMAAGGAQLGRFLNGLRNVDVLCDVGRLAPDSPSLAFVAEASAVLMVARPTAEQLQPAARRMLMLRPLVKNLGWVLIGQKPYGPLDVEATYDFPVVGVIADDPRSLASLERGMMTKRLRRQPFIRSAGTLADTLATWLAPITSTEPDGAEVAEPDGAQAAQPEPTGPIPPEVDLDSLPPPVGIPDLSAPLPDGYLTSVDPIAAEDTIGAEDPAGDGWPVDAVPPVDVPHGFSPGSVPVLEPTEPTPVVTAPPVEPAGQIEIEPAEIDETLVSVSEVEKLSLTEGPADVAAPDIPDDGPEHVSEDVLEHVSEDVPDDGPEDVPEHVSEHPSDDAFGDVLKDVMDVGAEPDSDGVGDVLGAFPEVATPAGLGWSELEHGGQSDDDWDGSDFVVTQDLDSVFTAPDFDAPVLPAEPVSHPSETIDTDIRVMPPLPPPELRKQDLHKQDAEERHQPPSPFPHEEPDRTGS